MDNSSQVENSQTFDSVVIAAELMLSGLFGSQVHFDKVERLSEEDRRNLILRCSISPAAELPPSYIIKKVEAEAYEPENLESWDTQRFFHDWVGSQFLSSLGQQVDHSPRFYAGNRELGFIILEDLGHHRSLVEPLLHEDALRAEAALLRYSTRLGRMHADTVNQMGVFEKLLGAVGPSGDWFGMRERELQDRIRKVLTQLASLGISIDPALPAEMRAIVDALMHPGPFLAYIHGDPCPDNVFDDHEKIRLIDFEFGHFGHALRDATYGRMVFPTCWCANRLPRSIVAEMEQRYREELIQGCPEAKEDRIYEHALVAMCGFWLLRALAWHLDDALKEDHDWGIASLRQRVLARLDAFALTSEEFSDFPALRATAGRLLELLAKQWTGVPHLPLYPAFQAKDTTREGKQNGSL